MIKIYHWDKEPTILDQSYSNTKTKVRVYKYRTQPYKDNFVVTLSDSEKERDGEYAKESDDEYTEEAKNINKG
jgi:hypothetical protein